MKNNKQAFTLVELIVVITILAILGTIAFISLQGYSREARESVRISDIKTIQTGLELYSVKAGIYPEPDDVTVYTGGEIEIKQGNVGERISSLLGLGGNVEDPLSGVKYTYSVFGNNKYYQVSGVSEESTVNLINTSYATTNTTAIVKGNYYFDPNLPSLILVPGSVGEGLLFSPETCFVLNGGENTVETESLECIQKKDLSLSDYDNNLVGYWDMETYYQTSFSGVENTVFLKDLSGNGYDMYMRGSGGINSLLNTIETSSGSIFTGTGGIKFDNNNFTNGFRNIIKGQEFVYDGNMVNYVPGDIFTIEKKQSGTEIIPGISSVVEFDYNRENANNWNIKRLVTWGMLNKNFIEEGDFYKLMENIFVRFRFQQLQETFVFYNDGLPTETSFYGQLGCGDNDGNIISSYDFCNDNSYFNKRQENTISGRNVIVANVDFNNKNYCIYLNGSEFNCETLSQNTIDRLQELGYQYSIFSISSGKEPFSGVISDVKIYKRALSEKEIEQQAKIAGF